MTRVAALILALTLASGPVFAEEPLPLPPSSPDIIGETSRTFMKGLRRLVDQIPMYEPPRVTSDGDIILKRIHPPTVDGEEARAPHETGGVEL